MKGIIRIFKESYNSEFISDSGMQLSLKRRLWVYVRVALPWIVAMIMLFFKPNGFEASFVDLLISVLSIIVGIFIAVLIFTIEVFPISTNLSQVFKVSLLRENNEEPTEYHISFEKINHENTMQKDWRLKSQVYVRRIIHTLSMNVVFSILALILLFVYVFSPSYFGLSLDGYEICKLGEIDMESVKLFFHLMLAGGIRILILSFTLSVLIYTIHLISNIFQYVETKNIVE